MGRMFIRPYRVRAGMAVRRPVLYSGPRMRDAGPGWAKRRDHPAATGRRAVANDIRGRRPISSEGTPPC